MDYPNRIHELRERSRLTQDELARLIGITLSSVSKHEVGTRVPSRDQIIAYAKVFKVETHELFMPSTDPREPYPGSDSPVVDEPTLERIRTLDSARILETSSV